MFFLELIDFLFDKNNLNNILILTKFKNRQNSEDNKTDCMLIFTSLFMHLYQYHMSGNMSIKEN